MSSPAAPSSWNIANAVTVVRLLLVPVFVTMLLAGDASSNWRLGAFAVFVVASLTDRLDGELARRRGLVTDFGKIADPIADKALIGSALVALSAAGEVWWTATAVILLREVAVTVLRLVVLRHGVIPASRGGKLKTVLQTVAIGAFLLPYQSVLGPLAVALMAAAVAVTLWTGVDYVVQATRLRRAAGAVGSALPGGSGQALS